MAPGDSCFSVAPSSGSTYPGPAWDLNPSEIQDRDRRLQAPLMRITQKCSGQAQSCQRGTRGADNRLQEKVLEGLAPDLVLTEGDYSGPKSM